MTSSDQPVRGPVGMPAHLWELAKSDVRLSVPNRVRNAVANGLNAPEGVRRIAARVAVTGAAMGVPAAILGLGGFLDTADTPVDLAGGEAPLDGFDGAPAMPGSYDGGSGPGGGHDGYGSGYGSGSGGGGSHLGGDGPSDGFAHATTHSDGGDVASGLGSTWHVQDPTTPDGDWLTVQMFQDVTVTETADGMFVVDAWQFIVIRDDDGNEYVFKEHYQVIVPDPPGQETDLIIHERGFVHVVERPDGTFGVETDFGIDVVTVADGDGRDEVTIGQSQHVRYTDTDGRTDDDVRVDLSEKATSTSEDEGDEATTTIDQDQVFDDGTTPPKPFEHGSRERTGDPDGRPEPDDDAKDPKAGRDEGRDAEGDDRDPVTGAHDGDGGTDPSSPFGEEPADRGTGTAPGTGSSPAPSGTGTAPAASAPAAASGSGAASTARVADQAPLAGAAVAAPAASVLAGDPVGLTGPAGPELDAPPAGTEQSVPAAETTEPAAQNGPEQPDPDAPAAPEGTGPEPFGGAAPSTGQAPFETPDTASAPGASTAQGNAKTEPSTPDDREDAGDNTAPPAHESQDDTTGHDTPEPAQAEHTGDHDADQDPADHGTDGADHALVG